MRFGLPLEDMIAQWSPQRLRIHVAASGFSARYDEVKVPMFTRITGGLLIAWRLSNDTFSSAQLKLLKHVQKVMETIEQIAFSIKVTI
jgi:hypothetical protein